MFKPGDHVTYVARDGAGSPVRAVVKRAHRDGSCTIEAMFFVGADGCDLPGYLGYKSRLENERLTPRRYANIDRAFERDLQRSSSQG